MFKKFTPHFFFVFISFIASVGFAQNLSTKKTTDDSSSNENLYVGANIIYKKTTLKDSTNITQQYLFAEKCRLNYDYTIAEYWYNKVYSKDTAGKQFPECSFWLATMKKNAANYSSAKALFTEYLNKNSTNSQSYLFKKAQQEIASCEFAEQHILNPDTKIKIKHLDTTINSKVTESAPFQTDSVLFFSSLRDYRGRDFKNQINYNKIYVSTQSDSIWKKVIELDTIVNEKNINNANASFNADKTKMYISRCKLKDNLQYACDIYVSELKNNVWSPFKKLPPEINSDGLMNTQPSTGYFGEQEVLFFASNRIGGEGKMDIWYSKINADGNYDTPVNAGKNINSMEDEITPFFNKTSQELFFSSTWHKGLGGFDIFKSAYSNNSFSEPQNLGSPINSNYNDIYFSMNTKTNQAFLSSNRTGSYYEEKENCCNDIYMLTIPVDSTTIKAKQKYIADSISATVIAEALNKTKVLIDSIVTIAKVLKLDEEIVTNNPLTIEAQMKQLIPITLFFHNDEPDRNTMRTTTSQNYKSNCEIYSTKRNLYKRVATKNEKIKDTILAKKEIDILFDSINKGMQKLEELSQLMLVALKKGENVTITIKSYCSPLASDKYNANLAKRRVSSLKNFFNEYENGALTAYTKGKNVNLKIVEKYLSESKSSSKVSHNIYDMKNSVFTPLAAYERRIQISAVSSTPTKTGSKKK